MKPCAERVVTNGKLRWKSGLGEWRTLREAEREERRFERVMFRLLRLRWDYLGEDQ